MLTPSVAKLKEFILQYRYLFLGLGFLLFLILYTRLLNSRAERRCFEAQRIQLGEQIYLIDSLKRYNYEQLTKTFSWAIRAELLRRNLEQVDQLLLTFIRHREVNRIDLIDPETGTILLSTNRKRQDMKVDISIYQNLSKTRIQIDSANILVSTPVMGLDEMMAVIDVEYARN